MRNEFRTTGCVAAGPSEGVTAETIAGMRQLWEETQGDPAISIAILDGPVDLQHPCFHGASIRELSFVGSGPAIGLAGRHGTHTASVIFGQHDSEVKGVAPRCRGIAIPIFRNAAQGGIAPCSQADLARAIRMAAEAGANVINISAGQFSRNGTAELILERAIRDCTNAGRLVVAAAGNDGCDCLHVPGAVQSVLAVGAMNANGDPLKFSNWGEAYRRRGVLALGQNVVGAVPGGATSAESGTSAATPIVAGVAALLMSKLLKTGRRPDGHVVKQAILRGAVGCEARPVTDCRRLLVGRLNVPGAVTQLQEGADPMAEHPEDDLQVSSSDDSRSACTLETEAEAAQPPPEFPADDVPSRPSAHRRVPEGGTASEVPRDFRKSLGTEPERPVPPDRRASNGRRPAPAVTASACACNEGPARLVYALGSIDYDFGILVRQESVENFLKATIEGTEEEKDAGVEPSVHSAADMVRFLREAPYHAESIVWTLNHDQTPYYAIRPDGPYAPLVYERLVTFLNDQIDPEQRAERAAIPGFISGDVQLMTGQKVPVIVPELRGMANWTTAALVTQVCAKVKSDERDDRARQVGNFLQRVYFELRNLGQTPQERAMNFAATNAYLLDAIFEHRLDEKLELDEINVAPATVCRPDSDCWDITLSFFSTENVLASRTVSRYTIDVSDVIPVQIGDVHEYRMR